MEQTTFADVIQKSLVALSMGGMDRITSLNIVINLAMSFLVGMFIFYMYKRTFRGVLYQKSFNISLVLASTITSLVIMTISGNLILSLGMVGALSIVRFRTPIKDSMDLVFLFWAISSGIANGVGFYNISIIGSLLIATFLIVMTSIKDDDNSSFMLLVEVTDSETSANVLNELKKNCTKVELKTKTINADGAEMTIEIRTDTGTGFLDEMVKSKMLVKASLVAFDQDQTAA